LHQAPQLPSKNFESSYAELGDSCLFDLDFIYLKVATFGKAAAMTDISLLSQATAPDGTLREAAALLEAALRVCPSNVQELPFQLMGRRVFTTPLI
jgi:hypothetical protein